MPGVSASAIRRTRSSAATAASRVRYAATANTAVTKSTRNKPDPVESHASKHNNGNDPMAIVARRRRMSVRERSLATARRSLERPESRRRIDRRSSRELTDAPADCLEPPLGPSGPPSGSSSGSSSRSSGSSSWS